MRSATPLQSPPLPSPRPPVNHPAIRRILSFGGEGGEGGRGEKMLSLQRLGFVPLPASASGRVVPGHALPGRAPPSVEDMVEKLALW